MLSPRIIAESRESGDSDPGSPRPPETSHTLCPWPRKRKLESRRSMGEFDVPTRTFDTDGSNALSFALDFYDEDQRRPISSIPKKPETPQTQKRRKLGTESLYKALNPDEREQAEELNRRLQQLLKELEIELRSFSIREAICKKPTICMRPPKKSKLMTKRSLGF